MINIRNIITALLVVSTILLISCSQGDNSENITGGYFGYNSKYNGYTNHAVFRSYEESEKIAKELVNGINQSNKIYNNTLKALMPQLYLDNGTTYIREEGTCINNKGFREYGTRLSPATSDNVSITSYIQYKNYCLDNKILTTTQNVVVNNATNMKEIANYDGNLYNSYFYELTLENNVNITIQNGGNYDNLSLNGIIYKNEKCFKTNNTECPNQEILLRMDMPNNETKYRFDLQTTTIKNDNTFKKEKIIRFYHHEYGYVEADITFLKNETISNGDKITMKFQNKDCKFSIDEFKSKEFYCGEYGNNKK